MIPQCSFGNDLRLVGDPVDTYTGAVVERQQDFRIAGHLHLEWWRVYNSQLCDKVFVLGRGHSHEFASTLKFDIDGVRFQGPLGQTTSFSPLTENGQSVRKDGKRLTRLDARRYQLHEHYQTIREYVFTDPLKPAPIKRLIRGKHAINFQYNQQSQLESIIDSLANELNVVFNSQGLLAEIYFPKTSIKDRRTAVRYDYDERGNLELVTDLYGNVSKFGYDVSGRMTSRTDRNGHTFIYQYDTYGRCIHTAGSDGVLDKYLDYELDKQLTKVTQPNGAVWHYRYELGKLVSIDEPLGGKRLFVYDDKGTLQQEIDSSDNVSVAKYNDDGALIGKVDSLGYFHAYPEDPNEPDPLAHHVAQNSAEYEYGRLVSIEPTKAENSVSPADLQVQNQRSASYIENTKLDSNQNFGIVLGQKWWPAPSTGRRFDFSGNLFQQINRRGNLRRWVYNANGNVIKYVDFDGGVWKYGYRSWNHLVEETNPLDVTTRMEYDSQENITAFVDGGGTRSEYAYDLNDNLVAVRRHEQLRETYQRDSSGNLTGKFGADGAKLLSLEYSQGNLVAKRHLSSGDSHTYKYDRNGRYALASTTKDTVEFQYDGLGNRTLETRNGIGVQHDYRGWRQFGKSVWFDKFQIAYEKRRDGSLTITDPTGGKHQLFRTGTSTIQRKLGNGTSEDVTYDELGRCTSKRVSRPGRSSWVREYHWSGEGELLEINDSIQGRTINAYDAAHRLTSTSSPGGLKGQYRYDDANNLIQKPGEDEIVLLHGNRIAYAKGEKYEYNNRNHVHTRTNSSSTTLYIYDSRDQLIRVESERGVWEAEYDALGRRTRKTFNGETTEYFWNTDQLAAELTSTGNLRLYIYIDALALTPMMFVDYDSVDAEVESGKCYFVLANQIGAPVCVEDQRGNVVWQAKVEAFGHTSLNRENQIEFNFRFPGHYWDEEIGLNYNRFRYFDPSLGRYIQSDPLGIGGGENVYAYPTNPLLDVDVRGLTCTTCGKDHTDEAECPGDAETTPKKRKPSEPDQKKWVKKGGSITNNPDGSTTYTRADGVAVTYRDGYPDFGPHAAAVVQFPDGFNGDHYHDFIAANGAIRENPPPGVSVPAGERDAAPPAGYTWHHSEDGKTMQLVPTSVHNTSDKSDGGGFPHSGGVSVLNQGDGERPENPRPPVVVSPTPAAPPSEPPESPPTPPATPPPETPSPPPDSPSPSTTPQEPSNSTPAPETPPSTPDTTN